MTSKRIPNPLQEMAAKFLATHEAFLIPDLLSGKKHDVCIPVCTEPLISWVNLLESPIPEMVEEYSLGLTFEHSYISKTHEEKCVGRNYHRFVYHIHIAPTCSDQFGNVYVGEYEYKEGFKPCSC